MNTLSSNEIYTTGSAMTPETSLKHNAPKAKRDSGIDLLTSSKSGVYTTGSAMTPAESLKRSSQEAGLDSTGFLTPAKTPSIPAKSAMLLKLEIPQQATPREEVHEHKRPITRKGEINLADNIKLVIPQQEISKEESRKLKMREAAAQKWEAKLQRPMPTQSEIQAAYPGKLLRQYPGKTTAPPKKVIRPQINKSARVQGLLRALPPPLASGPPKPYSQVQAESNEEEARRAELLEPNTAITQSDLAKRLAWEAFSSNEKDRATRQRECMMISGLKIDDIVRERNGKRNHLPDWRKPRTGRFARSEQEG
jgi:hypothetical protein